MKRFIKTVVLGLLFYICLPGNTFSQVSFPNCYSNYFRNTFTNPGENYINDFVVLPSGNIIAAGYAHGYSSIVKHNNSGNILFSKKIPVPVINNLSLGKIRWASRSTLFISRSDGRDFYEIDTSCNILRSVRLLDLNNLPIFCYDMECLPGGDKIILFLDNESHIWIARVSANLSDLRWCKLLEGNVNGSKVDYRNVFIDSDKLFITGWTSDYYGFHNYGSVLQLNIFTGILQREKRIKLDFHDIDATHIFLGKMARHDNGYIVKASFSRSNVLADTDIMGYIRIDTNLNVVSIQSLKGINTAVSQGSTSYDLYPEADGSIVGIHGWGRAHMFQINNKDSVLWTKTLDFSLANAVKITKLYDGFLSLWNGNYNAVGVGYFGFYQLLKSTANGLTSCQTYPDNLELKSLPYAYLNTVTKITDSTRFHFQSFTVSAVATQFDASANCNSISTCNSIKIVGDSVHCNNLPTLYTGRRNTDCSIPVTFSVSPSDGVNIQKLTDSTSFISFFKSGNYWVRSVLQSSCGDIYDSMLVTAAVVPKLELGPDTLLCAKSTIQLKAQKGYNSYLWNDGSSADSLTVYAPGTYYIKVENHCKEIFTDTIHVNPAVYTFSAGADQLICNGDKINLTATAGFINYTWHSDYNITSRHTANTLVHPNTDTSYIVTAERWAGCLFTDTVSVRVKQVPLINLGSDIGFCTNDSVMLTAPSGFNQYNWSDGSSASSIYISAPGKYSVQATHMNGCVANDTVQVRYYPFTLPMLGPDTSFCMDQFHLLSAGNYPSYQWNTNESTSSIAVSTPGQYWVKVTNSNGCTGADTVNILNVYKNPADFLNDTASLCAGVPVILSSLQNFEKYTWSTGDETRTISTVVDGTFVLTVTDAHGCKGKDTLEVVRRVNCPNAISFYNAFSPNGDALNALFKPAVTGVLEKYLFAIYNRYGELIFVTTDSQAGWDGYYKGKLQSPGSYVFKCNYKFFGHPSTTKAGSFVLIR